MRNNLKTEYIKKLKRIEKEGEFLKFNSIDELKKSIEDYTLLENK
jgi:hypothetical protein